jgi:hypothetical protein
MQLRPPCDPSMLGGLKGICEPAAQAGPCQWSQLVVFARLAARPHIYYGSFLIDNPFSTSIAAMQQLLLHYTTARLAMI